MKQTVFNDVKVDTLEAGRIRSTGAAVSAAPTAATPGYAGELKCTGSAAYICLGGSGSGYTWKELTLKTDAS